MQYVKTAESNIPFHVSKFENETNKSYPYYQNGKKYALCPTCSTSVQIIGGCNNQAYSAINTKSMYAAHTKGEISGLLFDEDRKLNCIAYRGNRNNWQRIYEKREDVEENKDIEIYIEKNKFQIARDIENIIGFKCFSQKNQQTLKLFESIYQSFKENKGLCMAPEQFIPEYIPLLIIVKSNPVDCWGFVPVGKTKDKIINNASLKPFIFEEKKDNRLETKFKPNFSKSKVELVCVLNDDNDPQHIIIKLLYNEKELILNKIPANMEV